MKKFIKSALFFGLLMAALICVPVLVHAQIKDPNCDPLDPACPVDGGVGFLIAAGIAYGIKKMRYSKKEI